MNPEVAGPIDYFLTPISGYAYLGHAAAVRLAAEHGVDLSVRPMDSMAVFAAVDSIPPPKLPPARLRWRQTDMKRWADCRRLPLVVAPRHWPAASELASRAIIAAGAGGVALAGAVLEAVWAREMDVARPDTVALLARECGLDPDAILDGAARPDAGARYAANTAEAIRRGVTGSPTFFVGDEMFFGQDRLSFVKRALADAPAS